jgi:hypothetical protein
MSVQTPTGTISAENADNFEDIEKQFAVKGESSKASFQKLDLTFFLAQSSST